jgi:phospholipid transport system substrate-binding protein
MNKMNNMSSIMFTWRRSFFAACVAAIVLAVAAVPVPASAQSLSEQAQQLIRSAAERTVSILARKDMTPAEQAEEMRGLLHQYFGVDEIGQWVVGRYWRAAAPSEQEEFLRLFEDFILYGYANRFSEYAGEQVKIQNATVVSDDTVLVDSVVVRPTVENDPRVTWRVTRVGGRLQIRDVMVEGVSMAQTQRSDFTATIQQRGGGLGGLNEALKDKVAQLKADASAPSPPQSGG